MTEKVLITGISGQVGSYLAEYYLKQGWEVHGLVRHRTDTMFLRNIINELHLQIQDIRDPHGVFAGIKKLKPDVIHHMAAMTYVPYSWPNPTETMEINVNGTLNILEAVRYESPNSTVHFAGSSEEYGIVDPKDIPINESTLPRPASPYGISKLAGDHLFQQYYRSYGLQTVITRAFNHESPRRGKHFISTQIVSQALEIKHGKRERFTLGNLESIRDYSDARDIVEAYHLAIVRGGVTYGRPYNVCTQEGHTVKDMVDKVSRIVGIHAEIEQDPLRMRPSDIPIMIGNSTLFRAATGWSPQHSFEEMLAWMVNKLEEELYP